MPTTPADLAYYGDFPYQGRNCPRCGSADVTFEGYTTTLVGYSGGPQNNPNHHEAGARCLACELVYTRHWVPYGRKSWATARVQIDGRVAYVTIAGWPGCCERSYHVRCSCGKWVPHRHKGAVTPTGREQVWVCSCGAELRGPPVPVPITTFDRLLRDDDIG